MKRQTQRTAARAGMCAILMLWIPVVACGPPWVNPFVDDSIPPSEWSTPSRDGYLAAGHEPIVRVRDYDTIQGPYVSRETPHFPLWWEDPFEDKGDGDGQFAGTYADAIALPYSMGRFMLNTVAWPISAIVTPPGWPMVSDGEVEPGRDHDAKVGVSPDPTAGPADFGFQEEPIDEAPETDETTEADADGDAEDASNRT